LLEWNAAQYPALTGNSTKQHIFQAHRKKKSRTSDDEGAALLFIAHGKLLRNPVRNCSRSTEYWGNPWNGYIKKLPESSSGSKVNTCDFLYGRTTPVD
jgi:hypothetical protein